jgi:ethanolamine transporter
MNVLTIIILIFAIAGVVDKLLGNKFGLGKEFEKGFGLFAPMAFSMLGMLVIAPTVGVWLTPFFEWFYTVLGIDPSIIPASLFANDMGGMTLANSVCASQSIGEFNAFVVSSMMGCVVSFSIPFALSVVNKEQHKELFFGILCGIITIPVGCLVAGLICGIGFVDLVVSLLPLLVFSVVLAALLLLFTNFCIKAFFVFGHIIRCVAMIGLVCSIFTFLTKIEICPYFDTFENSAFVCVNACVTLSGALPLMLIVSKLLNKSLEKIGSKIGIDSVSAIALLASLVTNATTFGMMDKMNKKGVVINSAFAVSASFVFGSHLAFTMAYDEKFVIPMIIGKIISGFSAVIISLIVYTKFKDVS